LSLALPGTVKTSGRDGGVREDDEEDEEGVVVTARERVPVAVEVVVVMVEGCVVEAGEVEKGAGRRAECDDGTRIGREASESDSERRRLGRVMRGGVPPTSTSTSDMDGLTSFNEASAIRLESGTFSVSD